MSNTENVVPSVPDQEPDVKWPLIEKPVIVTRDLTLLTRAVKKGLGEAIKIVGIKLEVLVNGCLYIVCEDHAKILRRGNVLSRNLKETKKRGGSIEDVGSQCFIRYDGIYEARRGIGRIDGNYKKVETPNLSEWRKELDRMMRMSWTLHRVDGKGNEFQWIAEKTVHKNARVVDEKKVEAHKKTAKAASKKDKLDRRNTGMIPLLCGAADDRLFARIQDVRGIGRRMDWRGVVLENYIDQMRSKCLEIRRDAEQKCNSETLFGKNRTTQRVRHAAADMREYANHLRAFNVRPFTRALGHTAIDLDSAASLMEEAAAQADPAKMLDVSLVLRRIFSAMRILELHTHLEEVLVIIAKAYHRKSTVQGDSLARCIEELKTVQDAFIKNDPFTKRPLEHGFARKVLAMPKQNINIACFALARQVHDPKNRLHTDTAYEYLKAACAPF